MEELKQSPLHCLSKETGALTSEEINRVVAAVKLTSRELPDYFIDNPTANTDKLKREIFVMKATILYREGNAPHHYVDRLKRDLYDLRMKLNRIEIAGGQSKPPNRGCR